MKHVCEFCNEEVDYADIRDLYEDGEFAICVKCLDNPKRCGFTLIEQNCSQDTADDIRQEYINDHYVIVKGDYLFDDNPRSWVCEVWIRKHQNVASKCCN